MAKKTPFEVGRRCHVCSLRKILSGCRHSVPIGLVCLWVGAKIRHFFETNKFYSRKIILKPSERFFLAFPVNLPAKTKKREIRPFLGLWQWYSTDSPHWHFLNGRLNLHDLRKMQHNDVWISLNVLIAHANTYTPSRRRNLPMTEIFAYGQRDTLPKIGESDRRLYSWTPSVYVEWA